MHSLAQLNIAKARFPLEDPRFADFVAALDRVNAAAEASPGFIWRLESNPMGDAPTVYGDARYVVNLSVWESVAHLQRFVASRLHVAIMQRRSAWFERLGLATLVLWWIPVGHEPSVAEAQGKLDELRARGASAAAFNFKTPFPPPISAPS